MNAEAISAVHASFTITRELPHSPERVYAAWSDPKAKAAWFSAPTDEWTAIRREMDFRVDGGERLSGRWKSGRVTDFNARYLDIVPQRRIVYAYSMHVDEQKISVSLATIVLEPAKVGTGSLLDRLAKSLEG